MHDKQKVIFVSGANITGGGPLEIYKSVLYFLSSNYSTLKVIAIVNNETLFPAYNNISYISIRNYKNFIFLKFYYEYIRYYFISKRWDSILWLSLNDCSPTVSSKVRAVYCHNATPFYKRTLKDFFFPSIPLLQSFYYGIFYKINLKKNDFIIVQQKWLRLFFNRKYNTKFEKIIVNPPQMERISHLDFPKLKKDVSFSNDFIFIYPTKPQLYKNIEVICKAAKRLTLTGINNFKIIITVRGDENFLAKRIISKYNIKNIIWLGPLKRAELEEYYHMSNCLLFPSKLETWGLPLSEFKRLNKPILVSDLPYAKETLGDYNLAKFFNPDDQIHLASLMLEQIKREEVIYDKTYSIQPDSPYAKDYKELFNLLLNSQVL